MTAFGKSLGKCHKVVLELCPRGGRDNGPYADSFPLRCHFHGGGGGGGWVLGGGRGPARGGGGARPLHIWCEMAASLR